MGLEEGRSSEFFQFHKSKKNKNSLSKQVSILLDAFPSLSVHVLLVLLLLLCCCRLREQHLNRRLRPPLGPQALPRREGRVRRVRRRIGSSAERPGHLDGARGPAAVLAAARGLREGLQKVLGEFLKVEGEREGKESERRKRNACSPRCQTDVFSNQPLLFLSLSHTLPTPDNRHRSTTLTSCA